MKHKHRIFINSGFSLAEALIVMAIVCIVAALATPALTKFVKKKGQQTASGMYACYYEGASLKQWHSGDSAKTVSACTFKLNARDNAYYLIKAVGGGGTTPGMYVSTYIPRADSDLRITIGNVGEDTVVESQVSRGSTQYEEVLTALGGKSSPNNLHSGNVKSCALRNGPANCDHCTNATACKPGGQSGCQVALHPTTKVPSLKIFKCDAEEDYVAIQDNSLREDTTAKDSNNVPIRGVYKYGNTLIAVSLRDSSFPDVAAGAESGLIKEMKASQNRTAKMEELVSLGVGNKGKRGAVIIQW